MGIVAAAATRARAPRETATSAPAVPTSHTTWKRLRVSDRREQCEEQGGVANAALRGEPQQAQRREHEQHGEWEVVEEPVLVEDRRRRHREPDRQRQRDPPGCHQPFENRVQGERQDPSEQQGNERERRRLVTGEDLEDEREVRVEQRRLGVQVPEALEPARAQQGGIDVLPELVERRRIETDTRGVRDRSGSDEGDRDRQARTVEPGGKPARTLIVRSPHDGGSYPEPGSPVSAPFAGDAGTGEAEPSPPVPAPD